MGRPSPPPPIDREKARNALANRAATQAGLARRFNVLQSMTATSS
jgi:hypothetical protein